MKSLKGNTKSANYVSTQGNELVTFYPSYSSVNVLIYKRYIQIGVGYESFQIQKQNDFFYMRKNKRSVNTFTE